MKKTRIISWVVGFILFCGWADLVWGQTTFTDQEMINLENQFRQLEFKADSLSTQDSLKTVEISLLEDELKSTNEELELTKKKVKLVKSSWYENKWLYFGYGAVLSYAVTTLISQTSDVFNIFD
jgi:hypothetical protein